jgi:hypothetical protein
MDRAACRLHRHREASQESSHDVNSGHCQMNALGQVLPFPAPRERRPGVAIGPDEVRGQILFFTGVRYERQAETPPRGAKNGAPRSKHRRRG